MLPEPEGPREGQLGSVTLVSRVPIAGDSSAAGVGVLNQDHAFAGHFTRSLHRRSNRAVRWRLRAKSGLTTRQVHALLRAHPPPVADVAVLLTGVNDVMGPIPPQRAVQHRAALPKWLLGEGRARHVLFALLPQPLRRGMGAEAWLHDAAMVQWAAGRHNLFHTPISLQLAPVAMSSDGFCAGGPSAAPEAKRSRVSSSRRSCRWRLDGPFGRALV